MDMSFANQALAAEYMLQNSKKLKKEVYGVPEDIDKEIARLKLNAMGVRIDKLTPEQKKYLASWEMGRKRQETGDSTVRSQESGAGSQGKN